MHVTNYVMEFPTEDHDKKSNKIFPNYLYFGTMPVFPFFFLHFLPLPPQTTVSFLLLPTLFSLPIFLLSSSCPCFSLAHFKY